jgi:ribosomal protein L11 methyltransferase
MYLWRRLATRSWFCENETQLRARAGNQLAIVERPNRKKLQLEVASKSRATLWPLAQEFGGRIGKFPRDWLRRALRCKTKPVRVGNKKLNIPAGAAFGTGEHATTAMCVKMIEDVMRSWEAQAASPALFGASPKSVFRKNLRSRGGDRQHTRGVRSLRVVVDLGTGSGILALAARWLGAKHVIAIDNDPTAISTAKENARLNKISGVKFQVSDIRDWNFPRDVEVVTANLFSELLIEVAPRFRFAHWLILSGILRAQEEDVSRALTRHKIDIIEARRRGKWVAILARRR